jgi:hypothetical protein
MSRQFYRKNLMDPRHWLYMLVAALVISVFWIPSAQAQQTDVKSQSIADSISVLRSMLEERQNDRARLERMLNALNAVDSVYKAYFPTWIVLDEDLRQRIYKAFRGRYPNLLPDTAVVVVVTPENSDILQISIGSVAMGPQETHLVLSDSLRNDILLANYPLRKVDSAPVKQRKRILFGAKPLVVSMDASLFGAALLFGNGWGIELKIGHDEIGYPFWSTGDARIMAVFDRLKFGVMIPFNFGTKQPRILDPLAIRPRKLNGATGISAEFDQPVKSDVIGARFSLGELNRFISGQLTDEKRPYYLHTIGQLFYSHRLSFQGGGHLLTVSLGAGFHQVARGEVQPDSRIVGAQKSNFFSPIVRLDYVRQGEEMYGVTVQYYSSIIYMSGWIELVKNFIYVDLRYAAPIVRAPKPWEQPYFYLISPRFRLVY